MVRTLQLLVVEDDLTWWIFLQHELGKKFDIQLASTIHTARARLANSGPYDGIVMDGYLVRENTLALIVDIRNDGYAGPLFAFSSDREMRKKQMESGCSHELPKEEPGKWLSIIETANAAFSSSN
ncbi:hypothetical protein K2Q16_02015 [Patescibacteria group bacterium]|nr:hypothetical protein [Patescibacteria group bacterium]